MDPTIYLLGQLIIVFLTFGLISTFIYGLRYALGLLRVRAEGRRRLVFFVVAGLGLWLTILAVLAWTGFFRNFAARPPRLLLVVLPPLLAILVLLFSRKVRLLLLAIPPSWLLYAQSFRILMELFLWLGYRGDYVPVLMTFEGLNYDIIVGLTAPMAGLVFFGRNRYHRLQAVLWNVFGVALLLNIIAVSLMCLPEESVLHVFDVQPPNRFVADFPFIWIPGFIVPCALLLHLFSLKQMMMTNGRRRRFTLKRSHEV